MEKILSHVSWVASENQSIDVELAQNEEEIPLPEEDETLIDTQFIHWGYLNSCQTVSKGRKVKKEKWSTYWLELCGSTLRFYRDSSLHIESSLFPPPSSPNCILEENETKVAFFELENADVKVLSDEKFSQTFHRKSKKSAAPKVFRRHLFQLKLHDIHSTYVFQAPSHSAMLRWVSKIQESLDAIEHDEKSNLAEQRLKLARDMMGRKSKAQNELTVEETDADYGSADTVSLLSEVTEVHNVHPTLRNLRNQLAIKKEQIWQFEVQRIDFLGRGKGEFKRNEFICATKQDYLLVPGRVETFIPAGTKVTIFGQLPNRRWRCLIEMNELIKVMSVLVNNLRDGTKPDDDTDNNSQESGSGIYDRKDMETLENLLNNLPDYPLLGCLPTSILDMETNKPNVPLKEETLVSCQNTVEPAMTQINSPVKWEVDHQHETVHDDISSNIDVFIGDIKIKLFDATNNVQDTVDGHTDVDNIIVEDLKVTALDVTPEHSESESASDAEDDVHAINDNVQLRNFGSGIIIRKKLRQKGISIMVGSSSSEGEDENDDNENDRGKCNGITNAVYQKFLSVGVSKRSAETEKSWNNEEKDYIRPVNRQGLRLPTSVSCDNIESNGEFTTNPDLLHRFGQQSIHLEQDKALAKALIQVFHESKKGPDVQPPRNDRRTLKLSKSDDQGYGFWLQTYDFGKAGSGKKRTFVRYVEDEGPAYLAGLREGDVIVEVNGKNVEEVEHMKIVGLISETAKQLMLVVKFMDMVRRVELAVRLKKSQAKLKVKMEELEKIKEDEKKLYHIVDCESSKDEMSRLSNYSSTYSSSLEGDLDRLSLDTSSESGLGSLSSISDEVVVRTSKFEKRSSRVLDSIKELNCACTSPGTPGINKSDFNMPLSTTESDLLNVYSENIGASRNRNGISIKRTESMPVQRRSSYPLRNLALELEPQNIQEGTMEVVLGEQNTKYEDRLYHERLDVQDFANNSGECFAGQGDSSKATRSKSYKKAVNIVEVKTVPLDLK